MFFRQIVREDIGCAAYLVGSSRTGEAAVIDPRIDMVEEILEHAQREGLRIRYIVETHNHADHVSGHHRLAARTGATIAVHALASVAYPHLPLEDGDELELGEVILRVVHTPGHRPEHIVVAVIDRSRSQEPWLLLTGDSLFIGDVARPDLAVDGIDGARALYESLHRRLLTLAEGTMVYPGHVAGSLCGRVENRMTVTTLGFERRYNPALAILDRDAFVRYMNEGLPERPPNMARIVELNRAAEPFRVPEAIPLSPETARHLIEARDAVVLDLRSPAEFAAAHIRGALSVPLDGGQFQNRVGLVVPAESPLILVSASDEDAERAVRALAVIGYDRIAGYLAGGMEAWERQGYEDASLPLLTVRELWERLTTEPSWQVLDVREASEWAAGHLPGAVHVPYYRIPQQEVPLDPDRPLAVVCASGTRSSVAASLLQARGWKQLFSVPGGVTAWQAAGLPLVTEPVLAR
jgi:glyoxylase-like metal-dependent hydrolase (beta-lactamase superfamily II)/rhodanese-related sulfurtransferase